MINMFASSAILLGIIALSEGHFGRFFPRRRFIPYSTEVHVWYPNTWPINGIQGVVPPNGWNVPSVADGRGVKHAHLLPNGETIEHSHPFGDHSHTHDRFGRPVFPAMGGSPYANTGFNWKIPRDWRDLNTWAVVNPDSILTADDTHSPKLPDTSDLFPDGVDPSFGENPDPAIFPTSDKKDNPVSDVKPLEPIVPGGGPPYNNSVDNNQDQNVKIVITQVTTTKAPTKPIFPPVTPSPEVTPSLETCHKTGCTTGHECVFNQTYICPIYIPDVPCDCRPGCRVDYTFVPYGETVAMDDCGSTCSCLNLYGAPECNRKVCKNSSDDTNRADLSETVDPPVIIEPVVQSKMTDQQKFAKPF